MMRKYLEVLALLQHEVVNSGQKPFAFFAF